MKIKIYRTITLRVVLYGCETWSLTLREEHKLRVFENRVLRRIFGHKRDEVTGEYRKLRELELNDLNSSPSIFSGDQIKTNEISVACSVYGWGGGGLYRVLVGEPEGKRLLGRPRRRWEDHIEMDL